MPECIRLWSSPDRQSPWSPLSFRRAFPIDRWSFKRSPFSQRPQAQSTFSLLALAISLLFSHSSIGLAAASSPSASF
jgi:hypothetical protein